jgi:hypothetical protein
MNQTKQRQASPTPCDCSYPIRDSTNKPYQGREQALKTITAPYDRHSSQSLRVSESHNHTISKSHNRTITQSQNLRISVSQDHTIAESQNPQGNSI